MKHLISACLLASALTLCAAPSDWLVDFEAAKKKAVGEKKHLLVNFTGSDWCGFCIQLDKEVFQQEAFLKGVKDKFVLVTIDFPEDVTKLDESTRAQNAKLDDAYRVEGYPTIMLADGAGRPFGFTGFQEGGPENYVAHLDGFLKAKEACDKAMENAAKVEGLEKAGKVAEGLEALDLPYLQLTSFYQEEIRLIESIDKDRTLALSRKLSIEKRFYDLEAKVEERIEAGKVDEALRMVDEGIADPDFSVNQRQRMSFFKAVVFMESGKYDDALREIEVCRKFEPESEQAQGLDVLIHHIESLKQEAAEAAAAEPGKTGEKADKPGQLEKSEKESAAEE